MAFLILKYWQRFSIYLNSYLYHIGKAILDNFAALLGFPQNTGLWANQNPDFLLRDVLTNFTREMEFLDNPDWGSVARHINIQEATRNYIPNNNAEIIFGMFPEVNPIPRVFFTDTETGFYNYYVKDYLNGVFLPDRLSEFIQLRFDCHIDYSEVSIVREAMFGLAWIFSECFNYRTFIGIFIFINPYTFPWLLLGIVTDWLEEFFESFIPIVPFVDLNLLACRYTIGLLLDSLNNLILTFPYLPSEGVREYVYDKTSEDTPAIVFRGIPILWYKYGVPNDLRQHWYYKRPDIFEYIEESLKGLDVQLLPDEIIEQMNLQKSQIPHIQEIDYISTNFHYLFINGHSNEFFPKLYEYIKDTFLI